MGSPTPRRRKLAVAALGAPPGGDVGESPHISRPPPPAAPLPPVASLEILLFPLAVRRLPSGRDATKDWAGLAPEEVVDWARARSFGSGGSQAGKGRDFSV